jgi:predicted metal-dependent HD superfamily phosphohydrolase
MHLSIRDALRPRWLELTKELGCSLDASGSAFEDLADRYSDDSRHYHTLDHIQAVLDTVWGSEPGACDAVALDLAVWFHDAIYDTQAADNEERSAEHAKVVLRSLGVDSAMCDEVGRLILLTKTHRTAADDRDGLLLLDADLAVLGAPEPAYDRYSRDIRREYAWVPQEAYRLGRQRVLRSFLERPWIYHTERMRARLEDQARRNLTHEVTALTEG